MNVRKAILPVAGLGTRTLPASKVVPKEMFPIVNKPVIHYLIEEAIDAGIDEIIIIINEDKTLIKKHLSPKKKLEEALKKKNKLEALKRIKAFENKVTFHYAIQKEALGDGHAILCADEFINNEPVAVLFGDDIVDHPESALKQLLSTFQKTHSSVIAVTPIDAEHTHLYGIIDNEQQEQFVHKVHGLVEKPEPENAPSQLGIIGKYIITPEVYNQLKNATSSHGGEIRLIDGFIKTLSEKKEQIYAQEIQGNRFDTGQIVGLIKANIAFGLKDPSVGPELREYLKSLNP